MKPKLMAMAIAVALGTFMQRAGIGVGALALSLEKAEHTKLPKEVQSLYVEREGKYHLDLPEGIEDVTGMKSALQKERDKAKEEVRLRKELEKKFEGIDPDQVRTLLEKLGGDEEAQLIKAGKIDEVVARRMEKAAKAHTRALEEANKKVEAANSRAQKFSSKVLDNHIRAAAAKAGVHANAVEDALFRARTLFVLNEDGEPVQLDKDGHPVFGKDGKTPFSPPEWLDSMKEAAPHWFPSGNSGGGAGGDKGARGGAKTMKRADFDRLDPLARSQAMKDKIAVVD